MLFLAQGLALLLILFVTVYLVVLASLPYTIYPKTSTDGITTVGGTPKLNEFALVGLASFMLFFFSTAVTCVFVRLGTYGYWGVRQAKYGFAAFLSTGTALVGLLLAVSAVLNPSGEDPKLKFYFLDFVFLSIAALLCIASATLLMTFTYEQRHGQGAVKRWKELQDKFYKDQEVKYALSFGVSQEYVLERRAERKRRFGVTMGGPFSFPNLITAIVIFGYPLGIISLYKQEQTSDLDRIFIACVIHPIFMEVVSMYLRTESMRIGHNVSCMEGQPKSVALY